MKINPKLLKALENRGLAEPTLAQSSAWPTIASGSNVLLIAPTGVGKTEAAMVPLFHRLLEEESKSAIISGSATTPSGGRKNIQMVAKNRTRKEGRFRRDYHHRFGSVRSWKYFQTFQFRNDDVSF